MCEALVLNGWCDLSDVCDVCDVSDVSGGRSGGLDGERYITAT